MTKNLNNYIPDNPYLLFPYCSVSWLWKLKTDLLYFEYFLFPGKLGHAFQVHIHTSLEEGSFKLSRFHITKNNIRSHWYHGDKDADTSTQENTGQSIHPV